MAQTACNHILLIAEFQRYLAQTVPGPSVAYIPIQTPYLFRPLVYHRAFTSLVGETTISAGQPALSSKKLAAMPSSIRALASMLQSVYHGGSWTRTLSATLLHPPSEGIAFDKLFLSSLPEEWDGVKSALNNELPAENSGPTEANSAAGKTTVQGGETPVDLTDDVPQGNEEQSREELRKEAKEQALAKAAQILEFNPGLTTLIPTSWQDQALAQAMRGGPALGSLGRMLAVFDPKADEEPRVHQGQNAFSRYPALNVNRFTAFLDAIGQTMREKEDFLVVFEGRVAENRSKILQALEARKMHVRELMFIDNKLDHDALLTPLDLSGFLVRSGSGQGRWDGMGHCG